jgi:hypothetical protein
MRLKTKEEFIANALDVHANTYEYLLVDYINSKTKVVITCRTHGNFTQEPTSHLAGRGCPSCVENRGKPKAKKYTTTSFIEKAVATHGDRYDYSDVVYTGTLSHIVIGCKVHGIFTQRASSHILGNGCQKCAMVLNSTRGSLTLPLVAERTKLLEAKLFLGKFTAVHGATYSYDNFVYVDNTTKSTITCRTHGDFLQAPSDHKQGHGCPECALERSNIAKRMQSGRPALLYYLYIPELNLWKVGCTERSIEERFSRDKELTFNILYEKWYTKGSDAYAIEDTLLACSKTFAVKEKPLLSKGNSELRSSPIENIEQLIEDAEKLLNLNKEL